MSQSHQPFVHLHVHSEFSLLDGLSRIDHLAQRAKELNMPALALTDHGTMYATIQFYRACNKAGIKPILGVESYLAARRMEDKDVELDRERFHLLLLAQNQTGYQNLLKIVSAASLDGFYYRPRTDHDHLLQFNEGLITTTGCMAGEIPRAIAAGKMKKAHELMAWYVDVFGRDRFFIELQDHSIPELTQVNKSLIRMAERYKLRFLATNDVHYTTAEEAGPHDILLCIQTGKSVDSEDRLKLSDKSYYLKSHAEMAAMFGEIPGALDNSLLIAEMCQTNPEPAGYHLPHFDVPAGYSAESYLRHLCHKGLIWRYGEARAEADKMLHERLNHELGIIHDMGFEAYFLIVWDLCEFARERDIWWNVRGSGAGSLVAYTLGITGIDPIKHGLIFERFLNPDRVSMPDIDLDYPDDRRHEMIEYTIRKYGSDKVAQIITFGTMGARAAIRDVGRVHDIPLEQVDALAKLIPAIPGKPATIRDVLDPEHDFYSAELEKIYRDDEQVRHWVDTAQSLEGVARHASTHAAGVIISDIPLVEYTPLHRPTSGGDGEEGIGVVTQWPMEILDSIGLLKVDFLGLSTLTVLREAADLIERRHGVRYTMENIPYDIGQTGPDPDKDPQDLFDLLGRGEVAGVFQVEGAGMRRLMTQMKPRRFDNIIAAISLYRPGPMENIPDYIARMHGEKQVRFHHPDLEPILEDTYGILVYQEQIIRIAADLAGYAPGDADMIRKAVAKKKQDLMDKHRIKFTKGALSRNYSPETIDNIWKDIEFFARYGFNKAHAADYAVITCQTAFLKAHYPVEYMTALLSVERNNTDKVAQYLAEARRMGITITPPNIAKAQLGFNIEEVDGKPVIRFGLGAIKNAGTGAIELIIEEREANGPFTDLADLCERVDLRRVGKRALESMIKVGVFDDWGSRPQLLEALDRLISHSANTIDAAAAGQMSLFGGALGLDLDVSVELLRPTGDLLSVDRREILAWEKELIGVYISEHPITPYIELLGNNVSATTSDLVEYGNNRGVAIAGLLTYLRTLVTKRGAIMAFGTLEDLHGNVELIFFPNTWEEFSEQVEVDRVYVVRGKVRIESGGRAKIIVESISNNLMLARPGITDQGPIEPVRPRTSRSERKYADEPPAAPPKTKDPVKTTRPGQIPPPPPNFEPSETSFATTNGPVASQLRRKSDGRQSSLSGTPQALASDKPVTAPDEQTLHKDEALLLDAAPTAELGGKVEQAVVEATSDDLPEHRKRIVVVEIKPVDDWQDTCRLVVKLAKQYEGNDRLRIRVTGQKLQMDFPNLVTSHCPEFVNELRRMPSVQSIEAAQGFGDDVF